MVAKAWKQPKCPQMDDWIKKDVVHIHNGVLLSHKNGQITAVCDNMDRY